jgi:hypothetical protein
MKKAFLSAAVMMLMSSALFADGNKPAKHKTPKHQTTCSKDCKPSADCKPGAKCPGNSDCVCH